MRICKKFLMWTNVMSKFFKSPYSTATSASVEGEFSQLKNSILKHESRLISPDRFVVIHLRSLENSMKIVRSKQLFPTKPSTTTVNDNSNDENNFMLSNEILTNYESSIYSKSSLSPLSLSSDDTLNKEECWGGLKNERTGPLNKIKKTKVSKPVLITEGTNSDKIENESPKLIAPLKKRTKYIDTCPEIDRILNKTRTRSSKTILLQNGNLTTPCSLKKKKYIVNNTCAFDSLVFGIAIAYTDFPSYRRYIDLSENEFLHFVKDIVYHGSSKKSYNYRLRLLYNLFESINCVNNVYLINANCNVNFMINELIKDVPICIEQISCSNNKCRNHNKNRSSPTVILSPTEGMRIITEGISCLSDIMINFPIATTNICMLQSNDTPCNGTKTVKKNLQEHIFIELDALVYGDNIITSQITDIPIKINIDNDQ